MLNVAHILPTDDLLALEGTALDTAVARQLGYRLGAELSRDGDGQTWFAPASQNGDDYRPIAPEQIRFSTNTALALSLPLPTATDCHEDWIHVEMGPRGRWIVRLIRFYRGEPTQPWKSRELYVEDHDDASIPMATAYSRAWLFSRSSWPSPKTSPARMTLAK